MQLSQPFNANAIEPNQGGSFNQLPLGKHPVIIVSSEVKATKDNTGGLVLFELSVIDGPSKGASGPFRINLYNLSDKARAIAEGQMSALCHVTGQFLINDTAALHNIPFAVEVTEQQLTPEQFQRKQAGEQVTPFTQVSKILDINGNEPKGHSQGQPQSQQPAQQAQPAATAAAWGQQATAQPAQQPQTAQAGGWGQQAPAQPTQAPAPAAAAPAQWNQNAAAPATGKPAWGR